MSAPVQSLQPTNPELRQHTPTPWRVTRKYEIGPVSAAEDQSCGMVIPVADVYGDNRDNDAAFIVEAVNSHDELTESLALAEGTIDRLTERCEAYKGQVKAGSEEIATLKARAEQAERAVDALEAALRAALPYLDNSDSPGGCNGKHSGCGHCTAIAKIRAILESQP